MIILKQNYDELSQLWLYANLYDVLLEKAFIKFQKNLLNKDASKYKKIVNKKKFKIKQYEDNILINYYSTVQPKKFTISSFFTNIKKQFVNKKIPKINLEFFLQYIKCSKFICMANVCNINDVKFIETVNINKTIALDLSVDLNDYIQNHNHKHSRKRASNGINIDDIDFAEVDVNENVNNENVNDDNDVHDDNMHVKDMIQKFENIDLPTQPRGVPIIPQLMLSHIPNMSQENSDKNIAIDIDTMEELLNNIIQNDDKPTVEENAVAVNETSASTTTVAVKDDIDTINCIKKGKINAVTPRETFISKNKILGICILYDLDVYLRKNHPMTKYVLNYINVSVDKILYVDIMCESIIFETVGFVLMKQIECFAMLNRYKAVMVSSLCHTLGHFRSCGYKHYNIYLDKYEDSYTDLKKSATKYVQNLCKLSSDPSNYELKEKHAQYYKRYIKILASYSHFTTFNGEYKKQLMSTIDYCFNKFILYKNF